MKNPILNGIALCLVSVAPLIGADQEVSKEDQKFATAAAMGGMYEVQAGQLAEQKGSHEAVKEFGQMMVTDHTKANDELKTIAAAENIALAASLDEKHQKMIADLQEVEGDEFDEKYMAQMVKAHEKDVALFKKASEKCEDPQLKKFAQETTPVLEQHLEKAKSIQEQLKQDS